MEHALPQFIIHAAALLQKFGLTTMLFLVGMQFLSMATAKAKTGNIYKGSIIIFLFAFAMLLISVMYLGAWSFKALLAFNFFGILSVFIFSVFLKNLTGSFSWQFLVVMLIALLYLSLPIVAILLTVFGYNAVPLFKIV